MKRLIAITLALCLAGLCGGCAWMDGSYVSVKAHQVGYSQSSGDTATVSGYTQMRLALTGLVDTGATEGLFYLENYSAESAEKDILLAIDYLTTAYPIAVYAVDSVEYAVGTSSGQLALSVNITYRRTQSQISQIRTVRGISGAESAIAEALENCDDSLVLQITSYTAADFVQLVADYAALNPNVVMELPQTTVSIYPDNGATRVVELQFSYQTSREALRKMQAKVEPIFSSAELYVSTGDGDSTKFSQLYSFLMERFDYQLKTSITPAYSLLCYGVGDSRAFAQVYAAMCRQTGLDCCTVSGTMGGESRFWNIILVDGVYYHVDLLSCVQSGHFQMKTDSEMDGYVWDYSAYPACGVSADSTEE